jgi:hypothetical protein
MRRYSRTPFGTLARTMTAGRQVSDSVITRLDGGRAIGLFGVVRMTRPIRPDPSRLLTTS